MHNNVSKFDLMIIFGFDADAVVTLTVYSKK